MANFKQRRMIVCFVISGFGYVGKATMRILDEYLTFYYKQNKQIGINDSYLNFQVTEWESAEWHFICVPTPVDEDSRYDLSAIVDTINLAKLCGFKGRTVLRSTVSPADIDYIESIVGDIVVWPEFLRKATWEIDALNPPISIAGGKYVSELLDLFFKYKILPFTDAKTASMIKLVANSYLAMKIIVAHDIAKSCEQLNIKTSDVQLALSLDPRLGTSHWQQPGPDGEWGFGGGCLPKDTAAMQRLLNDTAVFDSYADWATNKNNAIKSNNT
jgi:nucleotide sugar dehydrogenase